MNAKLATLIAAASLAAAPALAQPQAERQMLMSNVGASMEALGEMVKGEAPFDATAAQLGFRAMQSSAIGFTHFFPEGSESGNETEAAPEIWSDRDGFDEQLAAYRDDLDAAVEAEVASLDAMKPVFKSVAENCKMCHEDYRDKNE